MSENYEELLDQKVDEVKDSIEDLEDPDYMKLLEMEEDGEDRKTIKEYLEKEIGKEEEMKEKADEEIKQIEEETSGGILGSFDREKVLVGGVLAGLIVGLVAGFAFNMDGGNQQGEIRNSLQQFYDASGQSPDSITVSDRNGMYYATVNISQQTENGTQTSSQGFYVSPDSELLFPEVQSPLLTNPYNLDDLIEQAQQPSDNSTGSGTGAQ